MLPYRNILPTRNYDAKKILGLMDIEYKRIHVCPNDCILQERIQRFEKVFEVWVIKVQAKK